MVADALIYHPAVSHYNKFVATTVGRDKVLRLVQYFSRFLSWYLYRTNATQTTVAQFTKLKANLGMVRKAMRIGKFVEHFKAAATAYDAKNVDPVVRYLTAARQLGYAGYMTCDTLTYLDVAGVRPSEAAKRFQKQASKFWLAGLSFSVLNGLYALYQSKAIAQSSDAEKTVEIKAAEKARSAAQLQLISDLCDLTIPLSALGYVQLDDGIVGLAGSLSSLLGVLGQWSKTV
ncbi:peroxisomal biogenesis factor 11 [Delphinella strobiligena]|nr:peroxisomal biogenesis factor 11 [Delphinella strobiligena]